MWVCVSFSNGVFAVRAFLFLGECPKRETSPNETSNIDKVIANDGGSKQENTATKPCDRPRKHVKYDLNQNTCVINKYFCCCLVRVRTNSALFKSVFCNYRSCRPGYIYIYIYACMYTDYLGRVYGQRSGKNSLLNMNDPSHENKQLLQVRVLSYFHNCSSGRWLNKIPNAIAQWRKMYEKHKILPRPNELAVRSFVRSCGYSCSQRSIIAKKHKRKHTEGRENSPDGCCVFFVDNLINSKQDTLGKVK